MIVAIVGSRRFNEMMRVEWFVRGLARKHPHAIVKSGGAPGVDIESEQAAQECGLTVISYRPVKRGRRYEVVRTITRRWPVYDQQYATIRDPEGNPYRFPSYGSACFSRNTWIVTHGPNFEDETDQVVAFWDGSSNGTKDSMDKAEKFEKPLTIYRAKPVSDEPVLPPPAPSDAWRFNH